MKAKAITKEAHVSEAKKRTVENLKKLIKQHPVFGIINLENLPSPQLQKMRGHLREKLKIFTAKKSLIKIALEDLKNEIKNCDQILSLVHGMPAFIFTKEDPFKLYAVLKKNKSKAPAKVGQIAPKDIVVSKGPTPFAPGPIIGELGKLGIKSSVEEGKVVVSADTVVLKEGEAFKPQIVSLLSNLKIEPMEIGLNLEFVYEASTIYKKDILDIDEVEFGNKVKTAISDALNLSVFAAYPTELTKKILIQKAYKDSLALAISRNILSKETVNKILGKAESQATFLKSKIGL